MKRAIELAKYIVKKCIDDNYAISNLQLQKILYYIQRDFLKKDSIAFYDEIEAWQFGPVVPYVYYYYCGFGAMPINIPVSYDISDFQVEDIKMINGIVEEKRLLKPWDMVNETHKADGAWSLVYDNGVGNRKIIPRSLIKERG